jgi:hypothetical protein
VAGKEPVNLCSCQDAFLRSEWKQGSLATSHGHLSGAAEKSAEPLQSAEDIAIRSAQVYL